MAAETRVLVARTRGGTEWELQAVDESGAAAGPVERVSRLDERVRELEAADGPRWVWWRTAEVYPVLLGAGVRVERCYEVSAVETLLQTYEGEPFVPPHPVARAVAARVGAQQISLFEDEVVGSVSSAEVSRSRPIEDEGDRSRGSRKVGTGSARTGRASPALEPEDVLAESPDSGRSEGSREPRTLHELHLLHAAQLTRITAARQTHPGFRLLVAAESAASLAAVEMGRAGLPWSVSIHDQVLEDLLGPRPQHTGRPRKLQALAEEVSGLLGPDGATPGHPFNPDSPADVLKGFKRQGLQLTTTRAWELKTIDHPAVGPLLRYKELARLHVAHGWAWQDQWVRGGRFRAEYVPGGVVTGRWATSGGGALQIPKVMRACVVADPGWVLVAADAGQLEPRILAALSGDRGMIAATADPDLYTALARQALGRPEARGEAKIGLLAAMYGARANTPAMVALQRRFPQALALLERAARTGEDGGTVRSVLGRTCPPPEPTWQDVPPEQALGRSRARGRFTRNFVIQASAADWANALVAGLRRRLAGLDESEGRAELVFFQHDEVIVHAPARLSAAVVDAIVRSGAEATALVLGERGVRIPLAAAPIGSYAEKN